MPSKVVVVGIGDDGAAGLMGAVCSLVDQADLLVGAARLSFD